ncbi:MAG: NAD(P)-dependent alcohol dehydrogenase [Saprospiraceae bacterium]
MKAIVRKTYGGPEVIEILELDRPKPKTDEVLIRVKATTVNRTDQGVLTGMPKVFRLFIGLFKPKRVVLGTDFAGEVVALGNKVTNFDIGDRVWGFYDEGLQSQAEYMSFRQNDAIARIPEGVSFAEAVASAEGGHYVNSFLKSVALKPGDKVLVYGATGAIGSSAVQILKARGLYVTAVGGTPNMERVALLGADKNIDYLNEDFTQDDETYDFVLDAVGKSSFSICRKLLTPKGIYISSELGEGAENLYLPLLTKLKGGQRVIFAIPGKTRESILYMTQLLEKGTFKPMIDRHYAMADVAEAYTYMMSGQKLGNVILEIG